MKASPKGIAFIAEHEGVVTEGLSRRRWRWTIVVGHTAARRRRG